MFSKISRNIANIGDLKNCLEEVYHLPKFSAKGRTANSLTKFYCVLLRCYKNTLQLSNVANHLDLNSNYKASLQNHHRPINVENVHFNRTKVTDISIK